MDSGMDDMDGGMDGIDGGNMDECERDDDDDR